MEILTMTLRELIEQQAAQLEQFGDNYEAIAAALNAPTSMANPRAGEKDTITETTTTRITMDDILAIVPTDEAAVIYVKSPALIGNMQQAIDANNLPWLAYLLRTATSPAIAALSQSTTDALTALLQSDRIVTTTTEYVQPATISGPSIASSAGLGLITATKVQEAMNS